MFPYSRDPIEADPFVIQQRADEAIREQRWTDFIDTLKAFGSAAGWGAVIGEAECGYRAHNWPDTYGPGRIAWDMTQFAETEGWDGVLSAIARALREAQHQAEEVERRR